MLKIGFNLTEKRHDSWQKRAAYFTSLVFAMSISIGITHVGATHHAHGIRVQQLEQERALALKAEKIRQTVCLTNIVKHEAGGEKPHVRKILGNVVRAMAADPTFSKATTPCELAKIGGMFSQIKYVSEVRTNVPQWPTVYAEMTQLMDGDIVLPAGWGCVRAFRVSDDELEKMSGKSLHQLGFTVRATGLKYFAAKLAPVGTEGKITFYSDRAGCKKPTRTATR